MRSGGEPFVGAGLRHTQHKISLAWILGDDVMKKIASIIVGQETGSLSGIGFPYIVDDLEHLGSFQNRSICPIQLDTRRTTALSASSTSCRHGKYEQHYPQRYHATPEALGGEQQDHSGQETEPREVVHILPVPFLVGFIITSDHAVRMNWPPTWDNSTDGSHVKINVHNHAQYQGALPVVLDDWGGQEVDCQQAENQ
ncbi:hypothetical protein B0H10DRAFT_1951423 [Mycena sp. CBHHK59/15]|nr:hypothetical protein B0H10DRAFT_1951423 [Mycena sp. CBHHK59/15]